MRARDGFRANRPGRYGRHRLLRLGVVLGVGVVLASASFVALARADDVTFSVDVNARRLGQDDQLQLTVTLAGRSIELNEDIALPSLTNLQLVAGPSTSTQMSFVNGRMSQSRVYTFVLQPIAPGHAEIGPVVARLSSGERRSAPISIEVVPGSVLPPPPQPHDPFEDMFGPDPFERAARPPQPQGKLLIEATVDRPRVFVGQPVLLTYMLYTQVSVSGLDFAEAPSYPGFWAEDLPRATGEPHGEDVARNGEGFRRFVIGQKLLFPTRPGPVMIPAATFRVGLAPRPSFFFEPASNPVVNRSTAPLTVSVEPLPPQAEASGAVGSFTVATTVDRDTITLGDAATVRFRIQGTGNLKWIEKGPRLTIPGARVYPPQVENSLSVTPAGIHGSKTWAFVVIPETAGELSVPPIPFVYFDPKTEKTVATSTKPLELTVRPGAASTLAELAAHAAAPAAPIGELRLRSDLDLPVAPLPSLSAGALLAGLGLVGLLHAGLLAGPFAARRMRTERHGETAPRTVRSALAELRRAARGGISKEAAATIIEQTLTDVFGTLDERAPADSGEREKALFEILRDVRFLKYAPQLGDYSEKLREVAERAANAVRRWA